MKDVVDFLKPTCGRRPTTIVADLAHASTAALRSFTISLFDRSTQGSGVEAASVRLRHKKSHPASRAQYYVMMGNELTKMVFDVRELKVEPKILNEPVPRQMHTSASRRYDVTRLGIAAQSRKNIRESVNLSAC